jgi:hypothetical protein
VNSDATLPGDTPGISDAVHTGTGVYTLTLTTFPANPNNLLVTATLAGTNSGEITWLIGAGSTVEVHTFDGTNTPVDFVFSIVVFDTTP